MNYSFSSSFTQGNLFYRESSFTVVVVKKLSIATVKKLPNEIAVEF